MSTPPQIRVRGGGNRRRCPYCHDEVGQSLLRTACERCEAWHHSECWAANGACAGCGYARPGQQPTRAVRTPVAAPGLCSRPGCHAPLADAVAVPRLCSQHRAEALARTTPVGRQLATLVLVASGLLLAWVTLVGIVVAQDLPSHAEPILVFVGLAWIGWCVGLSVWREHRRRTPGDAHANSRRLSADTPPPDYRDDEDVSG